MSNVVKDKLHTLKIESMLNEQKIISVKETDSLEAVVKVLSENKIHSCPVLGENDKCVGTIDMLDIVNHVVLVAPEKEDISKAGNTKKHITEVLEMASRALALAQVKHVMNTAETNTFVPLEKDNQLTLALAMFSSGIHRTPVVDTEGKLVGTLSQSAIINWLIEQSETHLKEFDALPKYLADIGLGESSVITATETEDVFSVLKKMKDSGVSAIPIVDADGKLVGNFSAVDLVGLYKDHLPKFSQSIKGYLKDHSASSFVNKGLPHQTTTLTDLLAFFKENKYHRVWILDNDSKPTGVVSHTDIMNLLNTY